MSIKYNYYVNEIIEELEITKEQFAEMCDISIKTATGLTEGTEKVTPEIADKLAKVSGVNSQTWLNLAKEGE